ncbi:hypothetical protein FDF74_03820 [Clostridium niameyense]|uniref:DUF6398 domain-containing protein n=1 Tax=Clostridium niameyense TaxID=1622073 RepID=A0A6M0R9Q9_9CLOT|nr:DUF6398 domain-containing protein [Clostridium niameyense]NEZ46339.1 hypothetical protein [Clostridium niameyense]
MYKDKEISENIKDKYSEIIKIIEKFCNKYFNEQYNKLCKKLCSVLCEENPSIILNSKSNLCACSIVYVLGVINSLFNGTECIKLEDLYRIFDVDNSEVLYKSNEIRDFIKDKYSYSQWNLKTDLKQKVICFDEAKKQRREERENLKIAQNIIHKAWGMETHENRIELAREALDISKNCVEAYILLAAEDDIKNEEREKLLEEALIVAKNIIGKRNFEKCKGKFWKMYETRPYMMAKFELAYLLWNMGEREKAIEHLKEMLNLNPDDNQGVRTVLVKWLIIQDDDRCAEKILERYKEDYFASVIYNKALLNFKMGKIHKANLILEEAIEANPYVPDYIIGNKKVPEFLPIYVGIGDEREAMFYAYECLSIWEKVDGAIKWLEGFKE